MKTLLINLPHHSTPYPLGLAYVAGCLQHEVIGVDSFWWQSYLAKERQAGRESRTIEQLILDTISTEKPDMIGITLHQFTDRDVSWIKKIREHHSCIMVAGGASVSLPENGAAVLRSTELDIVVLGDGEEAGKEIEAIVASGDLASLKNVDGICFKQGSEIVQTRPRAVQYFVDQYYPNTAIFPGQGKRIDSYKEIAQYSSRGCFWNCSYCSVTNIARHIGVHKRKVQSAESVIRGLDRIAGEREIDVLNFFDDDFLGLTDADFVRANDVFKGLSKYKNLRSVFFEATPRAVVDSHRKYPEFWNRIRDYNDAGTSVSVSVGVESMSASILERMGKKTDRSLNMQAAAIVQKYASEASTITYIMYLDHKITLDELKDTIEGFYDVLKIIPNAPHKDLLNKPMIPTRGSPTWYELKEEENLIEYRLPIEIEGYKSFTTYHFRHDDVAKAYLIIEYFKDSLHSLFLKGADMKFIFNSILEQAAQLTIPASEIVPIGAYYDINFKRGFMARLRGDETIKSVGAVIKSAMTSPTLAAVAASL